MIAHPLDAGRTSLSPESQLARTGYEPSRGRERISLAASASGRELADKGCPTDVEIAAETNISDVVLIIVDGCFVHADVS